MLRGASIRPRGLSDGEELNRGSVPRDLLCQIRSDPRAGIRSRMDGRDLPLMLKDLPRCRHVAACGRVGCRTVSHARVRN